MAESVARVLELWRELERAESALPHGSVERKLVTNEIFQTQRLYRAMTDRRAESAEVLDEAQDTISRAWDVVRRKARLETDRPPDL